MNANKWLVAGLAFVGIVLLVFFSGEAPERVDAQAQPQPRLASNFVPGMVHGAGELIAVIDGVAGGTESTFRRMYTNFASGPADVTLVLNIPQGVNVKVGVIDQAGSVETSREGMQLVLNTTSEQETSVWTLQPGQSLARLRGGENAGTPVEYRIIPHDFLSKPVVVPSQ